jgi:hypothetical protein
LIRINVSVALGGILAIIKHPSATEIECARSKSHTIDLIRRNARRPAPGKFAAPPQSIR